MEDIVVYVYSNYNTDWYYFSMVNNSTEIFNVILLILLILTT